jgi:hypothetical protein
LIKILSGKLKDLIKKYYRALSQKIIPILINPVQFASSK